MTPGNTLSIGQIAKATQCEVQTVRYYEQIGLLEAAGRTQGNQRFYTQFHQERLNFIRHSRDLGFSLDSIRAILDLTDNPAQSCDAVDAIARSQLNEVESKIIRLEALRDELRRMVSKCSGGKVADCRIVQVLADHSLCQSHGKTSS